MQNHCTAKCNIGDRGVTHAHIFVGWDEHAYVAHLRGQCYIQHIVFYFAIFYYILFYSILCSVLLYSLLLYSILVYSILFSSILFYSSLVYYILFCSMLYCVTSASELMQAGPPPWPSCCWHQLKQRTFTYMF